MEDTVDVLAHVTPEDRKEIEAVRPFNNDPVTVGHHLYDISDLRFTVTDGELPLAVGGSVKLWPGYCNLWMFTRPAFRDSATFVVLKHLRKSIIIELQLRGIHRAEARCMKSHAQSRRWIEFMGGRLDCELKQYGVNKEDFLQYSWVL